MTEHQYTVAGMTCQNCRRHVTDALAAIPGALDVQVDLDSGRATVRAEHPLTDAHVRAALEDAGYALK
jgi:copper chaperone CopZ